MLNKVVLNPLTNQKQMKKIVVDPFIDTESGYPVKSNARIISIVSAMMQKRFAVAGELIPENLDVSEYVLDGMVSIENGEGQGEGRYRVTATVFEKDSGKVLAAAVVFVRNFDTTPLDLYKDSPVFTKGKSYEQFTASVRKQPNENVDQQYHDRLKLKALMVKGDRCYEQKEFKKSLSYYNQVADRPTGDRMEVYNGQFTNLVKEGETDKAEVVFSKLAHASIAETSQISNKITFSPNAKSPVESKKRIYNIYIRQIAKLVAESPGCKVKIIGHCSRSGTSGYNDKLSLQRAQWVLGQMINYAPEIREKSTTLGRGFRENLVGTGADNVTDEIDRRVEFVFDACGS